MRFSTTSAVISLSCMLAVQAAPSTGTSLARRNGADIKVVKLNGGDNDRDRDDHDRDDYDRGQCDVEINIIKIQLDEANKRYEDEHRQREDEKKKFDDDRKRRDEEDKKRREEEEKRKKDFGYNNDINILIIEVRKTVVLLIDGSQSPPFFLGHSKLIGQDGNGLGTSTSYVTQAEQIETVSEVAPDATAPPAPEVTGQIQDPAAEQAAQEQAAAEQAAQEQAAAEQAAAAGQDPAAADQAAQDPAAAVGQGDPNAALVNPDAAGVATGGKMRKFRA